MKVVIDIKGELKNGDLLILGENGVFKPISKNILLKDSNAKIKELQANFKELKNDFNNLKLGVNEKLAEYHKILQLLTKEE